MADYDVVIIGAGLTGLTAANYLEEAGLSVSILEKEAQPGGRVRTEKHQGFLLDRGFQVFLSDYPEPPRLLEYDELRFKAFRPGAVIHHGKTKTAFYDPLRVSEKTIQTLFSPFATLGDKWRLFQMRNWLKKRNVGELFAAEEQTTLQALQDWGFSDTIIKSFFRPFLGGVFFDADLATSSRMLHFTYKMFGLGDTVVPENGMGAIPQQLADKLAGEPVRYQTAVKAINGNKVTTETGEALTGRKVLLATEPLAFKELNPDASKAYRSSATFYFAAPEAPAPQPVLHLNAQKEGWINNLAVMSNISQAYAPEGQALISITVLHDLSGKEDKEVAEAILKEAEAWFGSKARKWEWLKTYRIPYSLPTQRTVCNHLDIKLARVDDDLYRAGDYMLSGSINAAMKAGREAAQFIIDDLKR